MDFDNDLLLWIFGIAIAIALLGGSGRRRRWRRSRRKANRSPAGGQRRDAGARFPREAVSGRVVRITDGDGVLADVVSVGRVNVRLAYVDAPEHDQPWGPESKKALARLARGGELRFRLLYRNRYARAVALVWTAGTVVNEELVRQGHAWVYSQYVPKPLRGRYGALEREARGAKRGLWGTGTRPVAPWDWRKRATGGLLAWLERILRRIIRGE